MTTHRETAPCSRCKGVVVTVSIKGTMYECCGSMACDLARVPKINMSPDQKKESRRLVDMHNERLEKVGG